MKTLALAAIVVIAGQSADATPLRRTKGAEALERIGVTFGSGRTLKVMVMLADGPSSPTFTGAPWIPSFTGGRTERGRPGTLATFTGGRTATAVMHVGITIIPSPRNPAGPQH